MVAHDGADHAWQLGADRGFQNGGDGRALHDRPSRCGDPRRAHRFGTLCAGVADEGFVGGQPALGGSAAAGFAALRSAAVDGSGGVEDNPVRHDLRLGDCSLAGALFLEAPLRVAPFVAHPDRSDASRHVPRHLGELALMALFGGLTLAAELLLEHGPLVIQDGANVQLLTLRVAERLDLFFQFGDALAGSLIVVVFDRLSGRRHHRDELSLRRFHGGYQWHTGVDPCPCLLVLHIRGFGRIGCFGLSARAGREDEERTGPEQKDHGRARQEPPHVAG